MGSNAFTRARADLAQLSRCHSLNDPILIAARRRMNEAFVVHKIAQVLDKAKVPLSPNMRAEIDKVLDSCDQAAA